MRLFFIARFIAKLNEFLRSYRFTKKTNKSYTYLVKKCRNFINEILNKIGHPNVGFGT